MPRTEVSSPNRRTTWLLGTILGAGLGLRLWGIAFAASTPHGRPDEGIFAVEALSMFARPYNRLATGWPDGFFMVWHAMLRLERAWFHLVYGDGIVNLGCLLTIRPLAVILPVRVLSAVLGTATIYVVGRLAATLLPARARSAALWGASLYAVNYLVGRDGHFAVSDTALCLGVALTLLACTRAAAGAAGWLPWAGLFAGCTIGIKYSALGLVVPCAVAGGITVFTLRRASIRPLLSAVALAVLGMILLAPQSITHFADFKQGLLGLADRYGAGLEPPRAPRGWIFYAWVVLPASFGLAGYALCLTGLADVVRRIPRVAAPLAAYTVAFYILFLGSLQLVFVRYASPLVPALAAAGGAFAVALIDRLCARIELPRAAATAALAILVLTPPAVRLAQFDRLLARPDTRDLARDWLLARGAQATVLTEGGLGHVQAVEARHAAVCREELPAALWQPTPLLAVAQQPTPGGMGEAGWGPIGYGGSLWYVFEEHSQRTFLPGLSAAEAPDFLVQARGPRAFGTMSGEADWGEHDPACWSEAAHFRPGDLEPPLWDAYDAFFAPFVDFTTLERPGPEIFVYENRCKRSGS